jgi:hypothetical protein
MHTVYPLLADVGYDAAYAVSRITERLSGKTIEKGDVESRDAAAAVATESFGLSGVIDHY